MPIDFDGALIILIAAFDIFLVYRLFINQKQVIIKGSVPSRFVMLLVLCVIMVVATMRGSITKYTLAFNIAAILAVLLLSLGKTGIAKDGLRWGFLPTLWSKIYYYEIEQYSDTKIRLRAHLATSERNLLFNKDQIETVEAHMIAGGILSFAQFKELKKKKGK